MKRHTESAVRAVHHVQRIAEALKKTLSGTDLEGHPPQFLLLLANPYFSTCTGEGEIYKSFIEKRQIGVFIGSNVKARNPDDHDYNESLLRILPFDHAFNHCRKDAKDRKIFI